MSEHDLFTIDPATVARQFVVERFYDAEVGMLDERRFAEWVDLFSDDAHYFVPIRRTRTLNEQHLEFTRPGEVAFYDDNKRMLESRVRKFDTGRSWSEDPPSRTRHLVTNVRIVAVDGDELSVRSNFHVYRSRLVEEEDNWFGYRDDLLRATSDGLRIARRFVYLDHTVVMSPNLTVFF